MRHISLVGKRFTRLVALASLKIAQRIHYECLCDCGQVVVVRGSHLQAGATKSCGCWRQDFAKGMNASHRCRFTPEYAAYSKAKARCTNPNDSSYPDYGGRGIEFRFESFVGFINALKTPENPAGLRPSRHTLDRIDNDGHYEVGNIRWATKAQQAQNRRIRRWWKRPLQRVVGRRLLIERESLDAFIDRRLAERVA